MAKHLRIKTVEDNEVHFEGCIDDHTLCGLDINGDPNLGIELPKITKNKVTCQICIKIASYCKSFRNTEW